MVMASNATMHICLSSRKLHVERKGMYEKMSRYIRESMITSRSEVMHGTASRDAK